MVVRRAQPRQPHRRPRARARRRHPRHLLPRRRRRRPPTRRRWPAGRRVERPPAEDTDEHGVLHHAAIRAYGDTVHTFLDRAAYTGPVRPAVRARDLVRPVGPDVGITRLDHVVANVERGQPRRSGSSYYEEVLGFDQLTHFSDDQISTEYSALMSTVVWNHDKVVLPINEPAEGAAQEPDRGVPRLLRLAGRAAHRPAHRRHRRRPCGPCASAAFGSWTCPPSTTTRPGPGWRASTCPWDDAGSARDPRRPRPRRLPAADLHRDAHRSARPCSSRSSSARAPRGFGEGNFKALFESIERAQARRGNL